MKKIVLPYIVHTTKSNLEIAKTTHDTKKTPLIHCVIGNNEKKEIFEKKQESLEYTKKLGHLLSYL